MTPRQLGNTGLLVSPLSLGTVKFGRDQSVKYPEGFTLPTDEEARAILDQAKAGGINLLDTAPAYGIAEERLGQLLQQAGDRADWLLATKVGEEFNTKSVSSSFDFSADHTKRSLHRSLKRLRTDYLDLVLIHSDGNDEEVLDQDVLPTLLEWKEIGIIKAVGISTKTLVGGLRAIERGCDAIMVTYNPWHRDEEGVLDAAHEAGVGILIKKAFGSGHFGKDVTITNPVDFSLSFIFQHPAVTSVVCGTINPKHLAENMDVTLGCS